MSNSNLLYELNDAIRELDHNRVSWIDKHFIIDLNQKAQVLLESVSRLENNEKEAAITAAKAFITEVAPVISELNNQN
jgi:hypothetical protein